MDFFKHNGLLKMFFFICIFLIIIFLSFFLYGLYDSSKFYNKLKKNDKGILIRKFPYPFRAALAISSDIDGTKSLQEFLTIQEFLNTKNETEMGIGLGLEIGNSFYSKSSNDQFALISSNRIDQEVILEFIKLGYIDSIHSFWNARTRDEAKQIADLLSKNGRKIDVWVNHAKDLSNLGSCEWCQGDNIRSSLYHADFSINSIGYKFVWLGDVSSVVGQGRPLTFKAFFDSLDKDHFFQSLYRNVFKEIAKYLSSFFVKKYEQRRYNDLIYPVRLGDGNYVFAFVRNLCSYRGIGPVANSEGLSDALNKNILQKLIKSEGLMIVYTHLGKNTGESCIPLKTQGRLRALEREYREGNIYVTTTSKLLNYYVNTKFLHWHVDIKNGSTFIYIDNISDPVRGTFVPTVEELRGLSFYTDEPFNTHIFIGDVEISDIQRNDSDYFGRKSIMIPMSKLPDIDRVFDIYRQNSN